MDYIRKSGRNAIYLLIIHQFSGMGARRHRHPRPKCVIHENTVSPDLRGSGKEVFEQYPCITIFPGIIVPQKLDFKNMLLVRVVVIIVILVPSMQHNDQKGRESQRKPQ